MAIGDWKSSLSQCIETTLLFLMLLYCFVCVCVNIDFNQHICFLNGRLYFLEQF